MSKPEFTATVYPDGTIDFNNKEIAWRTNTANIHLNPDEFSDNIQIINSTDTGDSITPSDLSYINLIIENKKTDILVNVEENRKIIMNGITEFNKKSI